MNVARASSLAIRSSSRRRKRVSTSVSPWCLSGGGRRLLASTVKLSTRSVSSPRLLLKTVPSIPTRSPRSSSSRRSIDSSPRTSTRAWSWIAPSGRRGPGTPSCPARGARRAGRRRGSCRRSRCRPRGPRTCRRSSAIGATPGNECGNGSTPCSRRRSSFARRVWRSSESSGWAGWSLTSAASSRSRVAGGGAGYAPRA